MGFRSAVSSTSRPMSPSDRRAIDVLLGEPDAFELSAAQVAQRAGAHESTVVRLAQKLGYVGYTDLRRDLKKDQDQGRTNGMRSASGHAIASLAADEAGGLELLGQHLPQKQIEMAAQAVHDARRVYVLRGASAPEAVDLLERRLRRLGKVVVTVGPTAREAAEGFVSFEEGCLFMAFALAKVPEALPPLLSAAHRLGGASVLITDSPSYQFEPRPDHMLAAGRGRDAGFRTLLVPMTIVYALQLATYHLQPAHYAQVAESLDDLTRLTGGWGEVPTRPA